MPDNPTVQFVGRHRLAIRIATSLILLGTIVLLVLAVDDGARPGSMTAAIANLICWMCFTYLFGINLPRQADRQAAADLASAAPDSNGDSDSSAT